MLFEGHYRKVFPAPSNGAWDSAVEQSGNEVNNTHRYEDHNYLKYSLTPENLNDGRHESPQAGVEYCSRCNAPPLNIFALTTGLAEKATHDWLLDLAH